MSAPCPRLVRFGVFEFDVETGDLWRAGHRTRLQEQQRKMLMALVARPGELVTRDEVRAALWPGDTFVDFDAGLNVVVNKIRHVLRDSAASPRFIETIPKRGYRFIAPVARGGANGAPEQRDTDGGRRGTRLVRLVAAIAAVVFVAITLAMYLSRADSSRPLLPVPVTTLPGMEYGPAVSPDGSHIAFVADASDQWHPSTFQLYVQPIGASQPLKLTREAGDAWQPAWSPDGKYIAFLRHPDDTPAMHDVVLIPVTGGRERKLGRVAGVQHGLAWSPDGRVLAVVDKPSAGEQDAIYLMSMEDGSKQRLTSPPADYEGDCQPKFSPDGQSLAFVRRRTISHADIYTVDLTHRTLTHVVAGSVVGGLDWTQDGRSIVFASGEGVGLSRLSKVAASGGRPTPLGVEGFEPSVSRRNRSLMAYVRFQVDWNVWRVPRPLTTGVGASAHRLIDSTQLESSPRYSPNGKRIAFISRRSGTTEVWTSDSDGGNATRLTFLDRDDLEMDVAWSPDGEHVAFTSMIEGSHDIHIVAAQDGFVERVTATPEDERLPSFSQDGQWIYFASRNGASVHEIWKVSRAGGAAVRVTRNGGVEARESPDGRFLYFTKGRHQPGPVGIWRKRLPDGEEEKIVDHGDAQRWDVFDNGVCYVSVDGERRASIQCYDANRRLVQQVAALEKEPLPIGFSVAPDGRSILFVRVDRNESDLVMVEDFR